VEEKKKLLIISYYWPPSGGAGVQRIFKFAKYLLQLGYDPYVITVDESAASYPVLDHTLLDDVPAGIKVHRTKSFEPLNILSSFTGNKTPYGGFANKNKDKFSQKVLRFIRGNFFIPDARKGWVSYAYAKAVELIQKEKIDTVIISSPPHSSQLVGLKLKRKFTNIKWIADLRDPWTDIYYYKDMLHTSFAKARDARFEKEVVEQADELVVVSKPIVQQYLSKSKNISQAKIHVIPNGYDEDDFTDAKAVQREYFTFTYVGTIADIYRPEIFFESLGKAIQKTGEKVKVQFVGSRTENIIESIRKNNLESSTEFLPHVDHSSAIKYMHDSDALLLVIPDVRESQGILTGKLFEYLASYRTIICIGPKDGDAARIIRECNAGETFERNQSAELENYLTTLIKQRGIRTSNNNVQKYSRKNLTKEFASLL
jgi:glycosyltransferase involved in cell wall biosynthesis